MPSFQLSFLGQKEPGCYQLHTNHFAARSAMSSALPRNPRNYVYSPLQCYLPLVPITLPTAPATVTTFVARPYHKILQVTSILFCNVTHRWFRITSRQRFNQSYHPFKGFLPGKYLENERQRSFPRMSIDTDLERIVKIPDLENVIIDACNAIDQPMP